MARSYPTPELRRSIEALLGYDNLRDVRQVTIEIGTDAIPLVTVLRFVDNQQTLTSVVEQLAVDGVAVSTVDRPGPDEDMLEAIRTMPVGNEGWWRSAGQESFVELAHKLLSRGFTRAETLDVLRQAYGAVASEYGG